MRGCVQSLERNVIRFWLKSDRDGLSVRVSPKGRVVFNIVINGQGKGERLDIGTYPATELKRKAEEVIIRLRGELESNRNPRLVKQAENEKLLKP